ncbi:hypothetical protein RJ640_029727 [Escallonia rubra]|uniref:Choline kinase n=1 Tax=Escallonia rubra TaxID=112253 RepID=A0AA88UHB2_9ASTE|nr:hypothetical protein RJ640_029727 [Escallonia rubra]
MPSYLWVVATYGEGIIHGLLKRLMGSNVAAELLEALLIREALTRMAVKTNGLREGTISEELMKVLLSLASNWGDVVDMNTFKVIHLTGAMTNEVYRLSWPTKAEGAVRTVLVRIYGEGVEIFFNRDEEIRTFESISMHGHGPRLLGQFSEGRVEEFIHARTLSSDDLRDPEISARIAAKLREFHNLDMPGSRNVALWDRLRNWTGKARTLWSPEHAKEFLLDTLEEEIDILEKELSRDSQEVRFCHNDLQYGNVMIDEKTRTITLIDYEYASYNPVAYDLANHFCEMAANYHTDTPHILNYSVYPDLEERQRFIQSYISSTGWHVPNAQLTDMGGGEAYVNKIDFDYLEYARQRFQQYWLRKAQLLETGGHSPIGRVNGLAEVQ